MRRLIQAFMWWFVRTVLHRRYRVTLEGAEQLRDLRGPLLVMPNHPGYIEPVLVLSHLRLAKPVRPIVHAGNYRMPFLYPFMRLIHALEVPDLAGYSREAQERTRAMINAVVGGLANGECFLLYPSGRAQRDGLEVVGAARSAAEILERSPDCQIVLLRTRGLWGSMFTYAQTGTAPSLSKCLLRGFGWFVAGFVFFVPKREVTITVERIKREDLPGTAREAQSVPGALVQPPWAGDPQVRPVPRVVRPAAIPFSALGFDHRDQHREDRTGHDHRRQRDDQGADRAAVGGKRKSLRDRLGPDWVRQPRPDVDRHEN